MSNAYLDHKGRLVKGPCACGAPHPAFGEGVALRAEPPKLGVWRCGPCWRARAASASAQAMRAPASAPASPPARTEQGRML